MPEIKHADRFGDGVDVETTIMYMCHDGYWFKDHRFQKFVACLPNGVWSSLLEDCIGL